MRFGQRFLCIETAEMPIQADVIVVLGGRILPDGSLSKGVTKRVRKAAELLNTGTAKAVILSGGMNKRLQHEAIAMKIELDKQIERQNLDIVVEDNSRNTNDSARYCGFIMSNRGWQTAIVVTSPYHVSRATDSFISFGVDAVGCPAFPPEEYDFFTNLYVIIYEITARLKHAIWRT